MGRFAARGHRIRCAGAYRWLTWRSVDGGQDALSDRGREDGAAKRLWALDGEAEGGHPLGGGARRAHQGGEDHGLPHHAGRLSSAPWGITGRDGAQATPGSGARSVGRGEPAEPVLVRSRAQPGLCPRPGAAAPGRRLARPRRSGTGSPGANRRPRPSSGHPRTRPHPDPGSPPSRCPVGGR